MLLVVDRGLRIVNQEDRLQSRDKDRSWLRLVCLLISKMSLGTKYLNNRGPKTLDVERQSRSLSLSYDILEALALLEVDNRQLRRRHDGWGISRWTCAELRSRGGKMLN